jgi:hypothetical protein
MRRHRETQIDFDTELDAALDAALDYFKLSSIAEERC